VATSQNSKAGQQLPFGYITRPPSVGSSMKDMVRWLPRLTVTEARAAGQRANVERQGVDRYGAGHFASLYNVSPELATARDAMMERLATAGAGPTRIQAELENQAYTDLGLGGSLSPEDQRNADQGARGAMEARGMLYGNPGAVAEVLNRQQFADARRNQRRDFAMQTDSLMQGQEEANRAFTSRAFGQLWDTLDPYRRLYGGWSKAGGTSETLGQGLELNSQRMNWATNYNAGLLQNKDMMMSQQMAQQQMAANARSGMIGAAGNVVGALIGF
jgi:hypothetical protein